MVVMSVLFTTSGERQALMLMYKGFKMFVISEKFGVLYEVFYSGTFLEAFYTRTDAEEYVNFTKFEMENYYGA